MHLFPAYIRTLPLKAVGIGALEILRGCLKKYSLFTNIFTLQRANFAWIDLIYEIYPNVLGGLTPPVSCDYVESCFFLSIGYRMRH